MWLPCWLRTRKRHATPRQRAAFCPRLEALEDRTVPSQIGLTVTSLADSGPGTLRAAILAADAGGHSDKFTIGFAVAGTIDLQSPLPDLDNTIAIEGPVAASLTVERAAGVSFTSAIVTVDAGQATSFSGLTITNGNAGAIVNNGTLTVANCAVVDDGSPLVNNFLFGGGIYNVGTVTVQGSTFSGDSATVGGAIFNTGTVTVQQSSFSGNSAFDGGGIFSGASGTLTISGCTISGNSAINGGGIFNRGMLTVSASSLSGNTANRGGGILNVGTLTVNGCTLSGNSATDLTLDNGFVLVGQGGGIWNLGTTTVRDSYFVATNSGVPNSADLGGAIYNGVSATLDVRGSTFSGNLATEGAAIYDDAFGTLEIRGSTFTGNTASDSGGAIYNLGTATVQESTLSGNTAGSAGGGIFNGASGTLAVNDSTVLGNTAPLGADLYNLGSVALKDSTVGVIAP